MPRNDVSEGDKIHSLDQLAEKYGWQPSGFGGSSYRGFADQESPEQIGADVAQRSYERLIERLNEM